MALLAVSAASAFLSKPQPELWLAKTPEPSRLQSAVPPGWGLSAHPTRPRLREFFGACLGLQLLSRDWAAANTWSGGLPYLQYLPGGLPGAAILVLWRGRPPCPF